MRQLRWLIALAAGALVLAACSDAPTAGLRSQATFSAGVIPEARDDIATGSAEAECAQVGAYAFAYKFEDPSDGDVAVHEGNTITLAVDGAYFGFTSAAAVEAVLAKGGPRHNVYVYDPPVTKDDGLSAAVNPSTGLPYGLSHVTLCWSQRVESGEGGDGEELTVTKTVETSYARTHDWSIAKSLEPAELLLFTDGSGDATVTWTVGVTYAGSEDHDFNVSGVITIENTGMLDASITGIVDELAGAVIDVDCGDGFELGDTLVAGETLTCHYDVAVDAKVEGVNEVTVTTAIDSYGSTEPIVWGAPDPNVDASVIVRDTNAGFAAEYGDALLDADDLEPGEVTIFSYTEDYAWEDYGQEGCGDHDHANTAKVVGDAGSVVVQGVAVLAVRVQCFVFAGETAWAADGDDPGTWPYNAADAGGNWATYVEYAAKTTTLFAGQTIDVGSVGFSEVSGDGDVTITVALAGDWEFEDVSENLKVQGYAFAPTGNPEPGLFDHKRTCEAASDTCAIDVPAAAFYGVHVNVGRWIPDPAFP